MVKLSILIPSRNERYLARTVEDLLAHAKGDIEILAVIDGLSKWPLPMDHPVVKTLKVDPPIGMRKCINMAAEQAQGDYLMKVDAHCSFGQDYDEILKADCDNDWIVIPRRYALNVDRWNIDLHQPATDAHYLQYPWLRDPPSWHGCKWLERTNARHDWPIDDEMDSQGSCWFMPRSHFRPLDYEHYGDFFQESQELCLRTWLGGGRVIVNKKAWYAHWHKPRDLGRGYFIGSGEKRRAEAFSFDYWWNNRWIERKHDFEWLIDKFWPIPTWPADWRELHGLRRGNQANQARRESNTPGMEQSEQLRLFAGGPSDDLHG